MVGGRSEPWLKPAAAICIFSDVQLPVPGNIPSVCWTIQVLADIWFTCNSFPHMKKIWFQSRYLILCAFSCSHIHATGPVCATWAGKKVEIGHLNPTVYIQTLLLSWNTHSSTSDSIQRYQSPLNCLHCWLDADCQWPQVENILDWSPLRHRANTQR